MPVITTWCARLAELEAARHALLLGQGVKRVLVQGGTRRETEYQAASLKDLEREIDRVRPLCAAENPALAGAALRPARRVIRGI